MKHTLQVRRKFELEFGLNYNNAHGPEHLGSFDARPLPQRKPINLEDCEILGYVNLDAAPGEDWFTLPEELQKKTQTEQEVIVSEFSRKK